MAPRLIAIDMDGTLLNSEGRVSPRNISAIRSAESVGAEIVVATGRRHSYAMRVLRHLNLASTSALVSSNGTVIRTIGSKLLDRIHMSIPTALWLCEILDDFRSKLVITFDLVDSNGEDSRGALVVEHLDDLHASIGRWMHSNEPYIQQVDRLEDSLQMHPPIQMMLCGSIDLMQQAERLLLQHPFVTPVGETEAENARITLHRTTYPEKDLSILDILPASCSKASGLAQVAKSHGLRPEHILAIGDNWNDVPMLRFAGQAVLMANAPADLIELAQESGWVIAPSNDDDGVAVAIEAALAEVTV
jgi:hydroxymethylpyrimidine pyrophosphatase-like HAD family hydrolase